MVVSAPERFGSYLVHEQLGQGGMASVHRAELPTRNGPSKQVALKRLLPTHKRELVALFLDEARLLRYLHHPNIAETYDSGRVFGTYFIAMEYVRGPTLKELVEHCGRTVGSVLQPITLSIAAQICDALDHAHNQCDEHGHPLGIVHRDITPGNIILSDEGTVKLIDFGLAKAKVQTEESVVGVLKGKFGYIAPEYLGGKLDHRADLWAVGIIMYELLTSRRLFDGADAFETMKRVRQLPIPRPSIGNPRVTPELDEIVMTALQRDPERRWQSAAAMRDALHAEIARPGKFVDREQLSTWVKWVLEQVPGSDVSGLSYLHALIGPTASPTPEPEPPPPPEPTPVPRARNAVQTWPTMPSSHRAHVTWYALAVGLAVLLLATVIWSLSS